MVGNVKLYEVNMSSGQCSRCVAFEQLRIPCRHIQAVIYRLASDNKGMQLLYRPLQYFHGAYAVDVLHTAMSTVSIRIPTEASVETCETIRPPPQYRQAGTSLKRKTQKADHARGSKRTRNKVEGRIKISGPRKRNSSAAQSDLDVNAEGASEHTDTVEAEVGDGDGGSDIAAFFDTQLSAPTVKERRQYRCGQCSNAGHNTKTCTNANQEHEEAGIPIVPGKYLVGDCPFSICGIQSGYEKAVED
ncbi:hypothetical protein F441_08897 [Phytophthora nicotianae CJ01A1]|uniref:SWIM-type domain-containing protein n=1 Tax=Phytophthora nicotianae CJ01A1 TaxID=1317063 RepID=W2X158_PHYNI|nr:hypothetical protein F441_08897 [Phytophthora nicotianae CJ01A1]